MKKPAVTWFYFSLVSIPLLCAWLVLGFRYFTSSKTSLLDQQDSSFVVAYSDFNLNGNSKALVMPQGNDWIFTYTLRKGYAWPYAGMCIIPQRRKSEALSGTVELYICISASKAKTIPLSINEFVPGFTDTTKADQINFRTWTYQLKLEPGKTDYKIPVSDFELPLNWEKQNQASSLPPFNLKNIRNICIQNCLLIGLNETDEIRISKLVLQPRFTLTILILCAVSIVWLLLGFIWYLIQRKKSTVFIPYVPNDVSTSIVDEWQLIQAHISTHYMEDLDMLSIEKELGIARHKIAGIIKEKTSLIFKQYLNQVRIAEAKRLLSETNLPIGEVADLAGFGHISNFNRVFKDYSGISPSEFRKTVILKP